ncbi:MAG: hypothetical protein JSV75_00300 [Candidatus Bathyarchaeota archaeon]|nr:MAG: hypothetical protein JSV75_00300 [Candidatus Bathyarchaeota archaeon]
MKIPPKAIASILLIVILAIVCVWGFNTYLDLVRNPVEEYDYMIFKDGKSTKAKNGKNGAIDFSSTNASSVLQQAIAQKNNIYIKSGEYNLSSDILLYNKINARIISDGASLRCNRKKIVIQGDNYTRSQYNILSGLEIINGTVRIENSFRTTITNMIFRNCATAIELVNTETWSECTKIEDSHFIDSLESIVFRKPISNTTRSYAHTEINRCYFNLYSDNSVGILVENDTEFTDSLIQNVRIWAGGVSEKYQTGILVEGAMLQTLLQDVVFESFAESPLDLIGIKLGQVSEPPLLGAGVSFLGKWTARIHNPFDRWISGLGSAFRRKNVDISVGLDNEYGTVQTVYSYPLNIASFKVRIQVGGAFSYGEKLTIRFRLEFIDHINSRSIEKSFNQTTSLWLNDDDMLELAPSQNLIWAILVDAKTNRMSTNTMVQIDVYGITA